MSPIGFSWHSVRGGFQFSTRAHRTAFGVGTSRSGTARICKQQWLFLPACAISTGGHTRGGWGRFSCLSLCTLHDGGVWIRLFCSPRAGSYCIRIMIDFDPEDFWNRLPIFLSAVMIMPRDPRARSSPRMNRVALHPFFLIIWGEGVWRYTRGGRLA